jgi:DNA-binding Lrp family transcriptional regulator
VTGEVIDQSSRWRMLLDALSIHKRLSVTEAAELLGVPAATVRRDFEELARQQLATRTHGGVVATTVAYDLPARYRIAPATRVSGSLVPRPSWSGPERRERDLRRGGRQLRAPRRVQHQRRDGFPGAARHRGGRFTEDRGRRPGEDLHDRPSGRTGHRRRRRPRSGSPPPGRRRRRHARLAHAAGGVPHPAQPSLRTGRFAVRPVAGRTH